MNKILLSNFVLLLLLTISNACAISIDDLKKQLESQPKINVGFDVDDTLLFSSPAFYYANNKYCPSTGLIKNTKVPSAQCKGEDYWMSINNVGVEYSMPKAISNQLIDLHKSRGDNIWFITKRNSSKSELLTATFAKIFGLDKINKVIFSEGKDKDAFIAQKDIKLYYGDADTDIDAAQKAGARGIRVQRAPNSDYKDSYNPGIYHEDILDNSAF